MNNHLNPVFRGVLNAAAAPAGECAECHVLGGRHISACSKHVAPKPVAYGPDGFVRSADGRIDAFATANTPAGIMALAADARRIARLRAELVAEMRELDALEARRAA